MKVSLQDAREEVSQDDQLATELLDEEEDRWALISSEYLAARCNDVGFCEWCREPAAFEDLAEVQVSGVSILVCAQCRELPQIKEGG